jgi:hypothetical protein
MGEFRRSRDGSDLGRVGCCFVVSEPDGRILKLGLGALRYGTSSGVDASTLSADAPSATIGAGYEVRVGSRISLVPWVNVLASSRVHLDYPLGFIMPPTSPPDVLITVVQAGLGVTWH